MVLLLATDECINAHMYICYVSARYRFHAINIAIVIISEYLNIISQNWGSKILNKHKTIIMNLVVIYL